MVCARVCFWATGETVLPASFEEAQMVVVLGLNHRATCFSHLLQELLAFRGLLLEALRKDDGEKVGLLSTQRAPDDGGVRSRRTRSEDVVVLSPGAEGRNRSRCKRVRVSELGHSAMRAPAMAMGQTRTTHRQNHGIT